MPVVITNVTDGSPTGAGTFDVLMRSVTSHLDLQYEERRIRDEDYSTVYLGALQSAMSQAIQFELAKSQVLATEASIANTQDQLLTAAKQRELITNQILKTTNETELLAQKKVTEVAATEDVTTGTIGKQQLLYQRQADGFLRDAEQQAAKIFADNVNVQRSTDSTLPYTDTGLENVYVKAALDKLRAGVGA